jgi:uncharacterized protein
VLATRSGVGYKIPGHEPGIHQILLAGVNLKIAVIGGGAGGLTAAYLLDAAHEVHLFERHPILGGNVRTLGANVTCPRLEDGVIVENGVSWFHKNTYPNTHRLLDHLEVRQRTTLLNSSIILHNGHRCHTSVFYGFRSLDWEELWLEQHGLAEAARDILGLLRRSEVQSESELNGVPLAIYLDRVGNLTAQWARGIVGAYFSSPFDEVDHFPADMLLPALRHWLRERHCTVLPEGVFSYMQKMVDQMRGQIHVGVAVRGIHRTRDGITVDLPDGCQSFDRVVIATTPQCAWQLLCDPTPDESHWFGRWRDHTYRTTAHFSESMYEQRGVGFRTECDCFERAERGTVGYNCSLNELYGIDSSRKYNFSAHMEDEIEPDRILDQQDHVTPIFHVDSSIYRHQVRKANGRNHTYYVGAYLIDGLQEGAITTAMEVAALLGGRTI